MSSCVLCFKNVSLKDGRKDFNLIDGKGKFNVKAALQQLEVVVRPRHSAKYVCGECLRLLQRIQSARQKLNVLEDQASNLYRKGANRCGIGIKARTSKKSLFAPSTEEEDLGQENAAVGALPHLSPVIGGPVVLLESSEQVTEVPSPKAVTAHGKGLIFQVTSTPLLLAEMKYQSQLQDRPLLSKL